MADVIVGYKWVLDEADIRVRDDLSVDFSSARGKISEYDKNAIEAGGRIATGLQGKTIGVSCGAESTRKSFTDALARGLDEGVWVKIEDIEPDALIAARVLAAVAKQTGAEVVVCADGSSDDYARQTASRVGALLDWPTVTSVNEFKVMGETLRLRRKTDDCVQVIEIAPPVVISVLPEACPAPIPSLKSALAAKKKPVDEKGTEELDIDLSRTVTRLETRGYLSTRKCTLIEGETASALAAGLLDALKREGVLQ
jgi:electron transfer flavoprotein beta subunit